jgi:type IV pilus assembly protein PilV
MGSHLLKCENGFSLIESVIALTIFSIGLLAVASMQLAAIRGNVSAQSLTAATALAEGIMEEILARSVDHPEFETDDPGRRWVFTGAGTSADDITLDGAGTFQASYAIDADYGVPNLTRIQVRVSRTEGGFCQSVILVGFKRRS